jgi:NAD(P)-dependent dehydrogenase (short-subunit alcohol dehydrogenase family)
MLEALSMAGKHVIITGAGRGLGKQMALALADAGADIVCAARTPEQIEQTADEIRERGQRALAVPTDVAQSDQVDALVRSAIDAWGRVDVMIANAGGGGKAALKDVSEITNEDWYDTIDINFSSAFFCSRAIVPHFREQGGGVIINVASGTGMRGDPRLLVYGSSKAGVVTLTMSVANQVAKDNIRVNAIVPGFVLQKYLDSEDEISATRSRGRFIPAGRVGEAWELGPLALYLASDASRYVTGEAFVIDGGGLAGGIAPSGWDVIAGVGGLGR